MRVLLLIFALSTSQLLADIELSQKWIALTLSFTVSGDETGTVWQKMVSLTPGFNLELNGESFEASQALLSWGTKITVSNKSGIVGVINKQVIESMLALASNRFEIFDATGVKIAESAKAWRIGDTLIEFVDINGNKANIYIERLPFLQTNG